MGIKILTLLFALLVSFPDKTPAQSTDKNNKVFDCSAAREFSTVYKFLTDKEELFLKKDKAIELSTYISKGCTGAAARFIRVVFLLLKSGFTGNDATQYGKELALKSEQQVDAFIKIFKISFLRNGLDLDAQSALSIARRFSVDYKGDPEQALADYENIAIYCSDQEALALPKSHCAEISQIFALLGEKSKIATAPLFKTGLEFLTQDSRGPGMTIKEAIKVMRRIMAQTPQAMENFKNVFLFSSTKDGLALNRNDAIKVAEKVSANTYWEQDKTD